MPRLASALTLASLLFTASTALADDAPGPKVLDAEPGEPAPPGYVYQEKTRVGPIVGGSVLFGSVYALTAFAGFVGELGNAVTYDGPRQTSYASLFVPAVGPFMQIASSSPSAGAATVLAIDGIAQCAGVALLVYGLSSKRTIFVRQDVALAPVVGNGTTGAMLVGRF